MLRSMFSGVSGLRAHQTMMDVVSNNIANVNTAGYKASRITFQEAISQTLRGSSGGEPVRSGVNPMQIGLGVNVAAIDPIFTQGATQLTGRSTDAAIQGDGMFVVNLAGQLLYTRAGAFNLDADGYLTTPTGGRVQGWMTDPVTGAADFNSPVDSLQLPSGQIIDPVVTTELELGGNLPADLAVGETQTNTITVFDSLAQPQDVQMVYTKVADNQWNLVVNYEGSGGPVSNDLGDIYFNPDGTLDLTQGALLTNGDGTITPPSFTFPGGSSAQPIDLVLGGPLPVVQFAGPSTIEAVDQDGSPIGVLRSFALGNDGSVSGIFSNGETKVLGYIALAGFANNSGLTRQGESFWAETTNSGVPLIGRPGEGTLGVLDSGAIETSNTDLAQEFTNLIIAQRGFQANSRSITTSDELLQELVNLKR